MHISEGVLSMTPAGQEVLIAGAAATAVGTAIGLWKLDYHHMPRVGVLSAAFYVVSLIQVPLGPTSVHLVLSGLMGLVLGWGAFPAVLVALVLQAVTASVGGVTTLGINTLIMAGPAVACHYMYRSVVGNRRHGVVLAAGFAAGVTGILIGAALNAGALMAAGKSYELLSLGVFAAHLPLAAVEGLVTANVVVLLRKVRPEMLAAPLLVPRAQEAVYG
jgi:cobalt/nickel transport system permease protein